MPISSLQRHERSCRFRPVVCPYDSSHVMKALELEDHIQECSQTMTRCPYNKNHIMPNGSLQKHLKSCSSNIIECPYGTHNILARDLEDHQKECPFRFVDCPFTQKHTVRANKLEEHLLSCDYRILTCSYHPGHRMPAMYLEKHENSCSYRPDSSSESDDDDDGDGPNTYSCDLCNNFRSTNFNDFITHLQVDEDIDISYYIKGKHEYTIRVFSHFRCDHCEIRFSSSATACRVVRDDGNFIFAEEYGMDCKKCNHKATMLTNKAHFINKAKYLTIRRKYFPSYDPTDKDSSSLKVLVGHKQELCGYCRKLGHLCITA